MHGGSWACSKRVLCCSAFAVLTTIGCVALSTTCTTHGCARRHGELRDSSKVLTDTRELRDSSKVLTDTRELRDSSKVLTDKSRGVTSPRSARHEELSGSGSGKGGNSGGGGGRCNATPCTPWVRHRESGTVTWHEDPAWFASEVSKGPCPAAAAMYSKRYFSVRNRTCWDRLDTMQPLRARLREGAINWSSLSDLGDVTIVGDSLAEQHFVALVCYAWSVGVPVDGPHVLTRHGIFADWRAVIGALRLTFMRQTISMEHLPNNLDRARYAAPALLIIGGFTYGTAGLAEYIRAVTRLRRANRTLVVEALPGHFPGGRYRTGADYPLARASLRNALCDDVAMHREGTPAVNGLITKTIDTLLEPEDSGVRVLELRVEHLYHDRGDAHIGPIPATLMIGPQGRDCLHWCVAPGVLDALALLTLHELAGSIPLART